MSLTSKKTAEVNTSAAAKAALAAQSAASAAQAAAQNAAAIAANAAQTAGGAAQSAAGGMGKGVQGVKQGVYTARSWAAPRLENAADYCTTTVAPRVSSALRTTARQVSPADTNTSKRSSVLTWSVLGAAILAAVAAAAVMVRYRYRSAIDADSEAADEEVLEDPTASRRDSPDGTRPANATQKDEGTGTPADGRVATSGW